MKFLFQTFAHELGHALNMPHDFVGRPRNCRTDNSGNSFCQQGSVMDYYQQHVNKWSTCSTEAMNRLNFGTSRCSSKGDGGNNGGGSNPNPSCKDEKRWEYYCTNRNQWGGCNGMYGRWFKEHCKKSCEVC